jgi:pimeloyl-ACP methyl ester carboxylesterase
MATGPETVIGGGATRVIALHGWFGSSNGWGMLPELIDPDVFSWAFPDYRGYGSRRRESGEYTIPEIAADILELADRLEWDQFALVGHSMGGTAAQRVFADAPQRVTALIGVSPVPASGMPMDEQGWALFDGAAENDDNRFTIIDITTGNRQSKYWIDKMVAHSVAMSTREAFGAYLPSWANDDFSAELPEPNIPVHAIVGAHDPAVGEQTVRATWAQHLPGSEVTVLQEAGHYAMFEAPISLMTAIEKTLGAAIHVG